MAPVKVVQSYRCFNLNPQKLELIIHKIFNNAQLKLDVFDKSSQRLSPREWFILPLSVIEQAINLIITGEIIHYQYDHKTQSLNLKKSVR